MTRRQPYKDALHRLSVAPDGARMQISDGGFRINEDDRLFNPHSAIGQWAETGAGGGGKVFARGVPVVEGGATRSLSAS